MDEDVTIEASLLRSAIAQAKRLEEEVARLRQRCREESMENVNLKQQIREICLLARRHDRDVPHGDCEASMPMQGEPTKGDAGPRYPCPTCGR